MTRVAKRPLGASGLHVPVLGLGCQPLGAPDLSATQAGKLLDAALECGINLLDTAPAYGLSEERIGRHLATRRSEYLLVTKLGYGVPGYADWTGACIRHGVDAALRRLRAEHIDIALLHSCDRHILAAGEVGDALVCARDAGKIRLIGYSGENEALNYAVASDWCQVIETSVSFLDQASLHGVLEQAVANGLGVLAKRPLANAVWREEVIGDTAVREYRSRFKTLNPSLAEGFDWPSLTLRFAAFAPNVHCAILGTRSPEHLAAAVAAVEEGPLPTPVSQGLRDLWAAHGRGWPGVV